MGVKTYCTFDDALSVGKNTKRSVVICKVREGSAHRGGPFFIMPVEKFDTRCKEYSPEVFIMNTLPENSLPPVEKFVGSGRSRDYRNTYRRR